jgi:hypothetical protein
MSALPGKVWLAGAALDPTRIKRPLRGVVRLCIAKTRLVVETISADNLSLVSERNLS